MPVPAYKVWMRKHLKLSLRSVTKNIMSTAVITSVNQHAEMPTTFITTQQQAWDQISNLKLEGAITTPQSKAANYSTHTGIVWQWGQSTGAKRVSSEALTIWRLLLFVTHLQMRVESGGRAHHRRFSRYEPLCCACWPVELHFHTREEARKVSE